MERAGMINVVYVTSNDFKKTENKVLVEHCKLSSGQSVGDIFEFDIRQANIKEDLEVDLDAMVRSEVRKAYEQLRVPCIVEHAGLIFADYAESRSYPGGLTKAMWNVLGSDFVKETNSIDRRAIARAVVGYCDGLKIRTFLGETPGTIASEPRGERKFYWDTVFIPDVDQGNPDSLTYAEIAEHAKYGLEYKVSALSQSTKAMINFLDDCLRNGQSPLW